jgi:hypothetical protein
MVLREQDIEDPEPLKSAEMRPTTGASSSQVANILVKLLNDDLLTP